jgi:membrane protease subunit (stomatin/prohibitin family)
VPMMMRRRRPVARAAMMAGGAAVAYHAGKKRGTGQGYEQGAPDEAQYQQQPAPAPAPSGEDMATQLERLKKLLDEGVLTQAEFDAQKTKILQSS